MIEIGIRFSIFFSLEIYYLSEVFMLILLGLLLGYVSLFGSEICADVIRVLCSRY